jgi:hypothetical protein
MLQQYLHSIMLEGVSSARRDVCEKAVPPQQALLGIILSKHHHLQSTMFGDRWREKPMPPIFHLIYRTNGTVLTSFDVERGQPHIMWWAVVVRWEKQAATTNAVSNHLLNGTILTTLDVERSQQHIWQPLAWDDHATTISILYYSANATVLTNYNVEQS